LLKTLKQKELGFMMHLHPFDALQVEYLLQSIHRILKSSDGELCTLSKEEKRVADKMHEVLRKLPTRKEQSTEDYNSNNNSGNDSDSEQDSEDEPAEEVVAAKVKKTIEKHGYICDKNTIAGATSAILTDVEGFQNLLMKALCFHSFVHYFEEIPVTELLDASLINRNVIDFVQTFSETIYPGNDTIDCDTCKMHSHLHLSQDIADYGHLMNWDSGKGERGLKNWAKTARSATVQKQRMSEFMHQTALRVSDMSLLKRAERMLVRDVRETMTFSLDEDFWLWKKPHYVINLLNRDHEFEDVPQRGWHHNKVIHTHCRRDLL
jgi:hypothetical protein